MRRHYCPRKSSRERYTDLLTAAFQMLAEAPKSAPACDHIRRGYRRRNVERHMIYFRITDHGIDYSHPS
jgi:toxin ParE1/3/4